MVTSKHVIFICLVLSFNSKLYVHLKNALVLLTISVLTARKIQLIKYSDSYNPLSIM